MEANQCLRGACFHILRCGALNPPCPPQPGPPWLQQPQQGKIGSGLEATFWPSQAHEQVARGDTRLSAPRIPHPHSGLRSRGGGLSPPLVSRARRPMLNLTARVTHQDKDNSGVILKHKELNSENVGQCMTSRLY